MRVIDDTYNANPTSMCAAVDILAGFSGRTVLVLGDIGELGDWAEQGTATWATTPAARSMRFTRSGQHGHAVNAFGAKAAISHAS
jgi:UDP-N-acetylmuramoyl-tripeptide--D-alanyl-D-alanine ligase